MEDKFSAINTNVQPKKRERIALTKDACAEIVKAIKSTYCYPIEDYIDSNISLSNKSLVNKFKDTFLYRASEDCSNGFRWNNMFNLIDTFSFEKPNEFNYDDFLKWYKAIFSYVLYYNKRISDYRVNTGIFEETIHEDSKCEHTPIFYFSVNIDNLIKDDKELDEEDYEKNIPCLMASEDSYQNLIGSFVKTAEKFTIVKQNKLNTKNLIDNCKSIKESTDNIRIVITDYDLLSNHNIDEIQLVYKLKCAHSLFESDLTNTKIYIRLKNGIIIDNDDGSNELFNLVYKTISKIEDFYKKLITAFKEDNKNTYDGNSIEMSNKVLKSMNMHVPEV